MWLSSWESGSGARGGPPRFPHVLGGPTARTRRVGRGGSGVSSSVPLVRVVAEEIGVRVHRGRPEGSVGAVGSAIDEDVDRTEALARLGHRGPDRLRVGHVETRHERALRPADFPPRAPEPASWPRRSIPGAGRASRSPARYRSTCRGEDGLRRSGAFRRSDPWRRRATAAPLGQAGALGTGHLHHAWCRAAAVFDGVRSGWGGEKPHEDACLTSWGTRLVSGRSGVRVPLLGSPRTP